MENKKKFRWTYDWTFVCVCVRHARVYDPTVDDELKVPNITDLNDDDDDDDVTALEGPPQRENSTRVFPFTPFHPLPSPDGARHRPSARTKISRFSYGKKEKKKQKTKTNYATTARHLLPLTWLHFNTLRVCVRARLYNPCVYRIDSGPRSRPRKKLNGQGGKKHSDAAPLGRRTLEDIASRHVGRKEKKNKLSFTRRRVVALWNQSLRFKHFLRRTRTGPELAGIKASLFFGHLVVFRSLL